MYLISDIHGYNKKLIELIAKINPNEKETFIFLGDYIDRGPEPKEVIDFLLEFRKKYNCIFLRGNHEQMLLDSIDDFVGFRLWTKCGGSTTQYSYQPNNYRNFNLNSIPDKHIEFFSSMLLYYEDDFGIYAHAGIDSQKSLKENTVHDFLWIREEFILNPTNLNKKVIYGHTPIHYLQPMHDDKICIDCGMGYHYALGAFEYPGCKFTYIGKPFPSALTYINSFK